MSKDVIGELPWSLPGSRIFGILDDVELNVFSAEYETRLENSRLIQGFKVADSSGELLKPEQLEFGVVGFGEKVTIAFSALNELQVVNLSAEPLTVSFLLNQQATNPALMVAVESANPISASVQGLHSVELKADQELRFAVVSQGVAFGHQSGVEYSRHSWSSWMAKRPKVANWIQRAVDTSWYCLGVNSIHLRFEPVKEKLAIVPSVLGYVGVWQWDSYFISIGLKHGDADLAKTQLELVLGFPQPDGQLQDVIHDLGTLASFSDLPTSELESYAKGKGIPAEQLSGIPITKPPLATWAVDNLARFLGDEAIYEEFFDLLVSQHNWWWSTAKKSANSLPCYQHPYSSGLDDSPSFDDFQPATTPDLLAYLILEGRLLIEISKRLGREFDLSLELQRQETLKQALESSWDEDGSLFKTYIEDGFNESKTILTLMPLLTEISSQRLASLNSLLEDPNQFGGELAIPTVSRADEKYSPTRMWRGPIWANTNMLVIEGLEARGLSVEASELALKTLRLIEQNGGSYEYYDSETGRPSASAVGCFSWTSAVCIDLAVRYASN